jgi:DNA-binding NarL/FixJ family response regulator
MNPESPVRVLVVAAYPAVRAGLRAMLDGLEGISVDGEATAETLLSEPQAEADVVLIDIDDDMDDLTSAVGGLPSGTPVVFMAAAAESYEGALAGSPAPRALLLRDATGSEIAAAVKAVAAGLTVVNPAVAAATRTVLFSGWPAGADHENGQLTERELQVLRLLSDGNPNKTIALRLGISEHTVKFHVGAIMGKLGASSRTEAAILAARRGLLPL